MQVFSLAKYLNNCCLFICSVSVLNSHYVYGKIKVNKHNFTNLQKEMILAFISRVRSPTSFNSYS